MNDQTVVFTGCGRSGSAVKLHHQLFCQQPHHFFVSGSDLQVVKLQGLVGKSHLVRTCHFVAPASQVIGEFHRGPTRWGSVYVLASVPALRLPALWACTRL